MFTIDTFNLGSHLGEKSGLASLEHHAVMKAVDLHRGNLTRAAHALGISRTTLWRRIKGYRLSSAAC